MFIPNITPEGLAREIACRMMGDYAVAANDMLNAIRDFPALQHLMNFLLKPMPGQYITEDELNSAMNDLFTIYNRNVENNQNLNPEQRTFAKAANYAFVSMVYDSIRSRLMLVAVI